MKTFTAFLFALLFCSNVVADNAGRTKGVYDQEKLKKDIVVYRKELEKCDKNFDEMAHKAYSTAEMVESSDYLADCCQALAEKIIDEQYSKRAEDHKKALSAYIQAAYDISNIIYQTADVCGANGCGSMYYVLSKDIVATRVKITVEEYIQFLQQSLDNKK